MATARLRLQAPGDQTISSTDKKKLSTQVYVRKAARGQARVVDGQLVLKGLVASPDRVLKQKPVAWTAVDTCLYTLFYACGSCNITGIVTTGAA